MKTNNNGSENLLNVDEGTLQNLMSLPHKILGNHDVHGLEQMVLHELGHDHNFGLKKAGYFVDNPDFDCLKGIAGYCSDECCMHKQDMWENPQSFMSDMNKAEFHNSMNNFLHNALHKKDMHIHDENDLQELGARLGMNSPSFFTWPMKHGNHGILIFEDGQNGKLRRKDWLRNLIALLSLC